MKKPRPFESKHLATLAQVQHNHLNESCTGFLGKHQISGTIRFMRQHELWRYLGAIPNSLNGFPSLADYLVAPPPLGQRLNLPTILEALRVSDPSLCSEVEAALARAEAFETVMALLPTLTADQRSEVMGVLQSMWMDDPSGPPSTRIG